MKKKTMRLLAFMLVVVMVICMAPLASAEGEATTDGMSGVKVVYKFNKAGLSSGNTKTQLINNPGGAIDYADTNGFWRYGARNESVGNGSAYKDIVDKYLSISANGDAAGYIVLVLNVPVKGNYKVTFESWKRTDGVSKGGVYIIPASDDIQSAVKDAIKNDIGLCSDTVSYYDASGTSAANAVRGEFDLGTRSFEVGEYYVIFTQESNETSKAMRFSTLTLDGGANVVPMISSLTATENDGVKTVKAEATLMSDGAPVTEPVTYSYAVAEDDATIASVDPTTGVVTGKINATATIIATATVGSYSSSKSIEVPVTNPNMSGIKVVYDMYTDYVESGSWIDVVKFEHTNGFWQFGTSSIAFYNNFYVYENTKGHGAEAVISVDRWWSMKVYIPVSGEYTLQLNRTKYTSGGTSDIYFGNAESTPRRILEGTPVGEVCFYGTEGTSGHIATIGNIKVENPGEYIIVFKATKKGNGTSGTSARQIFKKIILDGGTNTVPMVNITSAPESIEIGKNANITAEAALMSDGTAASGVDIAYSVAEDDKLVAEVSENGVITGKAKGTATIIATATKGEYSSSKSIEVEVIVPGTGEEITNTKVSVAVQSENATEGTVSWNGATIDEVQMGDTVTATATAKEGYVFRYWKNSSGQVLSENPDERFVINTNSAITAVFDKIDDTADMVNVELYNANGMPFDSKTVDKGTTFAEAISDVGTPSYTGFGIFKHWSMYADESKIDDNMLVKENTRAVAIFNAPTGKYTVSVNGTAKHSDVLYGTEVTVSSAASDFSCWKLGEKIVSYDKSYKFTVWGDVNLTEVKGEAAVKAPVAILTTIGSNPLLIYNVPEEYTIVEAGILFGSTSDINISSVDGGRAVAARGTGQFTAQPKANAAADYTRGYLIFKNNITGDIRILYAD